MNIHRGFQQGSEQWFAVRKGRPTASQFKRIITPAKGDYSKASRSYMLELVAECFCPTYAAFMGNYWTDRGNELEPEARDSLAEKLGLEIEQVGFVTPGPSRPWKDSVGCSPDGLVKGGDGGYLAGVEIKCPSPATHVEYVLGGVLPDEYKPQVHGGMAITGLNEWHFYSFYPGMKPLHVVVYRDAFTAQLEAHIDRFILEYADLRARVVPQLQVGGGE